MSLKKNTSVQPTEILIVEDSRTQAEELRYLLERHHYKVSAANDGRQALSLFSARKPALVISDIIMPEMNGYELCKKIKTDLGDEAVPVILLTSLSNAEDVLEGLACGADNFITKPYSEDYILSSISQILASRNLQKAERIRMGVEIVFAGKKRFITAQHQQMLTLLLSSYEAAVHKNKELIQTQEQLRLLNENLEDLVEKRTATLSAEIEEHKRMEENILRLNSDITARKEIEAGLEKARKELEAANRELEAFTYSVSHDLRAPLRAVVGFSRILIDEHAANLPPDVQRYLGLVLSNTIQMGRLMDDLLSFSRFSRQAMTKGRIDPAALAREALDLLRAEQSERPVKITIGDLPACQGDRALLEQVFVNLLSNALKFTRRRDPAVIEVGSSRRDGETVYYVRDNGAGFDMRFAGKLFGVFQRLHRAEDFEGTGVGLAIVQRVVHRHGGRVWAEGEPDKGATFFFTLGGISP